MQKIGIKIWKLIIEIETSFQRLSYVGILHSLCLFLLITSTVYNISFYQTPRLFLSAMRDLTIHSVIPIIKCSHLLNRYLYQKEHKAFH